jgi:hypothetical protein
MSINGSEEMPAGNIVEAVHGAVEDADHPQV